MTQQQQSSPPIPSPVPQPESDFYWGKCKEEELWLRHCKSCDSSYFYPRDISPCCFSKDTEWIKASGKATLFTYGIVQRAPHPGFVDDVPFVTAVVELEEGPKMATNIVIDEPSPDNLIIGMDLEVVFEDINDDLALPKFKPA